MGGKSLAESLGDRKMDVGEEEQAGEEMKEAEAVAVAVVVLEVISPLLSASPPSLPP